MLLSLLKKMDRWTTDADKLRWTVAPRLQLRVHFGLQSDAVYEYGSHRDS